MAWGAGHSLGPICQQRNHSAFLSPLNHQHTELGSSLQPGTLPSVQQRESNDSIPLWSVVTTTSDSRIRATKCHQTVTGAKWGCVKHSVPWLWCSPRGWEGSAGIVPSGWLGQPWDGGGAKQLLLRAEQDLPWHQDSLLSPHPHGWKLLELISVLCLPCGCGWSLTGLCTWRSCDKRAAPGLPPLAWLCQKSWIVLPSCMCQGSQSISNGCGQLS